MTDKPKDEPKKPEPKKKGFWSRLGNSIMNTVGEMLGAMIDNRQ